MPRFAWSAWGLLVVVLDFRVGDWDVLPDLVGYIWLVVALAGAERVGRPFLLARSAALSGALASLVTGTPLASVSTALLVAALVVQAVAFAVVVYGLVTGVHGLPGADDRTRAWAGRLRWAAVGVGVALVVTDPAVYLVTSDSAVATPVTVLWLVARVAEAVVGVLTVVLLQRVARAGVLAAA